MQSGGAFADLSLNARVEVLKAFEQSSIQERRDLSSVFRIMSASAFFEDPAILVKIGHRFGCAVPT
jgi:hypothetical protein